MKLPAIVLVALVISVSCKTSKDTSSSTNTVKSDGADKIEQSSPDEPVNDSIYRLYISFFSRASGIDGKVKVAFDAFIVKFESDNKLKIEYETVRWGREGEIDMCFKLDELSKKKQEEFVVKSKEILSKSDRVYVYENAICRRKR